MSAGAAGAGAAAAGTAGAAGTGAAAAGTGAAAADSGAAAAGEELAGLTFEELLGVLEQLLEQMASPEVGIEAATALYEQAITVHDLAAERLAGVRARVERLAPGPA